MRILKLNRNIIANVSVDSFNLPNLHELDLSENSLQFLDPEVFSNTKNLKYLNLALNKFTTFATMIFHHLGSLEAIDIDYNDVGAQLRNHSMFQRNGFALTTKIQVLSLNGVDLNRAPDNFLADAYDLRDLRMAENKLTEIPELPFTLEYLDISDNPITRIDPEDFSNLPSLKELKLNNLLITEIPEFVFTPLKALTRLFLERNVHLTHFDRLAFGREVLDDPDYFMLEELSLRGSRLSNLSEDLAVPFGQLIKLDLQGNKWHCDCQLLWIKQLQIPERERDHVSKIFDLEDQYYTCAGSDVHRVYIALAITVCLALAAIAVTLFSVSGRPSRAAALQAAYRHSVSYSYVKIESNAENRIVNCA
ncbi:Leucine-rich repeat neuronal protein 1 [Eumeta japonica]|uniref:Leucine-rich repeat neuronal protein 1 n=1 Tax=Eumeta variegata TaxID=151549 RepID=A0A4C1WPR8_EUMVA|nr:Leucine-rich repeat neuronal protein 1 [Eumeta japonica]